MRRFITAARRRRLAAALVVAGVTSVAARPLAAQDTAPDSLQGSACTYERCALWVDGSRLVRGAGAETVARARWLRPTRLTRFVSGDSAARYAALYERASRRGTLLSELGSLAALAGLATVYVRDRGCGDLYPFGGGCRDGDALHVASVSLVVGGMVAMYASIPFGMRASRHHARALWWHNRQFAR